MVRHLVRIAELLWAFGTYRRALCDTYRRAVIHNLVRIAELLVARIAELFGTYRRAICGTYWYVSQSYLVLCDTYFGTYCGTYRSVICDTYHFIRYVSQS